MSLKRLKLVSIFIGQYLLGITWYVLSTSQIGQSYLGTNWYVSVTSQFGQSHSGNSW